MVASQLAHSAAASLEHGSTARLATNANSTRSTSVENLRAPSTERSAPSTPSAFHNPSSSQTVPIGRDCTSRNPAAATTSPPVPVALSASPPPSWSPR
jgi:hypothetical protein